MNDHKAPFAGSGLPDCPPEVAELRGSVAEFVRERVIPCEPVLDAGGPDAREALARLQGEAKDAGLWALPLPVELGGQGLPLSRYAHLAEAEGAGDHGPSALGSAPILDVRMLARHGSAAVRDRYLKRITAGELRTCYAMTDPDTPGTDPAMTSTRAHSDSSGRWTLHGRKWFTTGAGEADLVTVMARTDGDAPHSEGLSLLLVPTSAPGFRVVRELPILGAGGQWEIELDGVTVPADHLVGERGQALRIAGERLRLGRVLRCLRWLGQAGRAYELMCERARSRTQASGPLADRQLVQQLVFDSLLAIRTTRPLVYEAVARLEAGQDARVETGLAKVAAARMLQQVTDAAIQVHGAAGLGPDTPLPALFRAGRAARLLDGPDELHISAVARQVLRPAR
ncbi:acyl-CoA dehydrogenase family protein [Kitasatospora atroaurantiaca]|uniref:Alkylation response protein AidB-like acyl-CoA dehydrogenase n=1 Tax=Kitasatospora atroaurantiaca TaxID=285545 RepID=A0A561EXH6_9ACTN|nr:acyl-CoA dehydrogenase family protein [Kitasatospora atroaurantiaca]TWE20315.1 alkylation response protein AidB-like acyl-CoA dehydrogenase [Kitasatospora atroaurantiaca]